MIYQIGNQTYEKVQQLQSGELSDVIVLKNTAASSIFNIVQIIKSNWLAKEMLLIYGQESFQYLTKQGQMCLMLPYEESRPLLRFLDQNSINITELRQIALDLIIECMKSAFPYPIIYLILKQRLIKLHKDYHITLMNSFDLSEFNSDIKEKDCVTECVSIIWWILGEAVEKKEFELLKKRMDRSGYVCFADLLRDIKIIPVKRSKWNPITVWNEWKHKSKLAHFLFVLCFILAGITMVLLVVRFIYGDLPFLRIFFQEYQWIGTESMLQ